MTGSLKRGRDELEGVLETREEGARLKRGRVWEREAEEEEEEEEEEDDGDAYPESQQIRSIVDTTLKATRDQDAFLRGFQRVVQRDRETLSHELETVRVEVLTATKAMDTMRNIVSASFATTPAQYPPNFAIGEQQKDFGSVSDAVDLLLDRSHDLVDLYETLATELEAQHSARLTKLKQTWSSDREAACSLLEKGRKVSAKRVQAVLRSSSCNDGEGRLDRAEEADADADVQKIFPQREDAQEKEGAVRSVLRGMVRGVARMVREMPV